MRSDPAAAAPRRFEFFNHTGDIGVRLAAGSPAGIFEVAAQAFASAITEPESIQVREHDRLELSASELDLLLVDWLSELLYRFEVRNLLPAHTDIDITGGPGAYRLTASIGGEPLDSDRHPTKVLIKAVTYHQLSVVQAPGGWHAQVIFDI